MLNQATSLTLACLYPCSGKADGSRPVGWRSPKASVGCSSNKYLLASPKCAQENNHTVKPAHQSRGTWPAALIFTDSLLKKAGKSSPRAMRVQLFSSARCLRGAMLKPSVLGSWPSQGFIKGGVQQNYLQHILPPLRPQPCPQQMAFCLSRIPATQVSPTCSGVSRGDPHSCVLD